MSKQRKTETITAVYTITKSRSGEEFGNIELGMPKVLRGRWRRWQDRALLMDLLHEMFRSAVYNRPLRQVSKS